MLRPALQAALQLEELNSKATGSGFVRRSSLTFNFNTAGSASSLLLVAPACPYRRMQSVSRCIETAGRWGELEDVDTCAAVARLFLTWSLGCSGISQRGKRCNNTTLTEGIRHEGIPARYPTTRRTLERHDLAMAAAARWRWAAAWNHGGCRDSTPTGPVVRPILGGMARPFRTPRPRKAAPSGRWARSTWPLELLHAEGMLRICGPRVVRGAGRPSERCRRGVTRRVVAVASFENVTSQPPPFLAPCCRGALTA